MLPPQVRCEAGRIVCREGDKGDYFYVVESGVYAVYKAGEHIHTYRITDGSDNKPSFGELALMYARPRAATVRCVEPGTLWALDRSGFREAQKTSSKRIDVPKLLSKVKLLAGVLRFDQLQQLRDRMETLTFGPGERVITEGEAGVAFYVIVKGSATVKKIQRMTSAGSGMQEQVSCLWSDGTRGRSSERAPGSPSERAQPPLRLTARLPSLPCDRPRDCPASPAIDCPIAQPPRRLTARLPSLPCD